MQQAAEKLREVAPLLAENEDDDSTVLAEVEESRMAAKAGAAHTEQPAPAKPRGVAPRWP